MNPYYNPILKNAYEHTHIHPQEFGCLACEWQWGRGYLKPKEEVDDIPQAKETCEHYWAWVSPAGTSNGAIICKFCHEPSPDWLNTIYEQGEEVSDPDTTDYSDDDIYAKSQADIELTLIREGLLPNPNTYGEAMTLNAIHDIPYNVLVDHYERIMHEMSGDIAYYLAENSRIVKHENRLLIELNRCKKALIWILESYDLDEMANRVIGHVVGDE